MAALLLQSWLAGPLALRMLLAATTPDELGIVLCLAHDSGSGDGGDRQEPGAPPSGHVHDQCLQCPASAAVAVLIGEPGPSPLVAVPLASPEGALSLAAARRLQAYVSRAPPSTI